MRLRLPSVPAWGGGARNLRSPLVLNVGLALLAIAGIVASVLLVGDPATTATTPTAASARTVPVTQGSVVSTVSASGAVQSASMAAADFVTAGTVTSIAVQVGDTVAKDQTLAQVDPADAQAQLDTANANLTAARASLTRANTAGDDASIATAQAQVTSARAAADAASRALAGTTLKAPMAGTVTAINGAVGGASGSSGSGSSGSGSSGTGGSGGTGSSAAASSSSSGFIQLADLSRMQVSASFAEADATKLKAGQAATVSWAALTGATAAATVATIAPTATTSNNVNSYGVTVTLNQVPAGTRIGQTVTVLVTVAQADDAIRVPTAAVRTVANRHSVTVMTNGVGQVRAVEVGVQGDAFTQITSGLAVGEQVAIVISASTTGTGTGTGTGGRGGFGGAGVGGFGGGGVGGAGAGGGGRGNGP